MNSEFNIMPIILSTETNSVVYKKCYERYQEGEITPDKNPSNPHNSIGYHIKYYMDNTSLCIHGEDDNVIYELNNNNLFIPNNGCGFHYKTFNGCPMLFLDNPDIFVNMPNVKNFIYCRVSPENGFIYEYIYERVTNELKLVIYNILDRTEFFSYTF